MRLAVDAMGGDNAPDAIVRGCVEALDLLDPDDRLVLVGDQSEVNELLDEWGVADPRIEIEHAPDNIDMNETPARAVRSKPDSSIVRMAALGSRKAEKPVDLVLSAGNTGACVAAGMMHMRRLPGVHRPGIAVTIPAFSGPVVLCDAGANPEPKPTHLWQYALMAETYARCTLGIENPRIGLMNIGSEEVKGSETVKIARDLCKVTPNMNYVGFVEGLDFFSGGADVIITDGFLGNTLLKMAEGLARSLFQAIAAEIVETDPELAIQFEPVVKQIYKKNDYHETGGAPLLGVNGNMFIAHGSSEARTIRSAIRNSMEFVRRGVNDEIVRRITDVQHIAEPAKESA